MIGRYDGREITNRMLKAGLLAVGGRGLGTVDSDTRRSRRSRELAVWGRRYDVRGETGASFVICRSGGMKSCSKSGASLGEENITPVEAAKGSASTRDFWYDKRMSKGVFGPTESSEVTVTADTAFENGLDVRGP